VEGYSSLNSSRYTYTQFANFRKATFPSNHPRGYFWRERIISNREPKTKEPRTMGVPPQVSRMSTIKIGMTAKDRDKVVRRLRG